MKQRIHGTVCHNTVLRQFFIAGRLEAAVKGFQITTLVTAFALDQIEQLCCGIQSFLAAGQVIVGRQGIDGKCLVVGVLGGVQGRAIVVQTPINTAVFPVKTIYLSPIFDLCSGDVVTYTLSDSPNLSMVTTMLTQAFEKIADNTKLILHSDQGWHYRHKAYVSMLKEKGIRQSMSRKGNCYDNAVMENFFGHLKSELLYLQEFESLDHFKQELMEYIDYYNNRRIKARLKGLPPALHRQQALSAA